MLSGRQLMPSLFLRLNLYIFRLEIYSFNLKTYISKLRNQGIKQCRGGNPLSPARREPMPRLRHICHFVKKILILHAETKLKSKNDNS